MLLVKLVGKQQLKDSLEKIKIDSANNLKQALFDCAIKVENSAARKCPVVTGRLVTSITHQVTKDYALVGTNVEYAKYVEGTYIFKDRSRHKITPFLYPALTENREYIKKRLGQAVIDAANSNSKK